jgi:pimeloyl-ACP methyl ester carboxylesterase
MDLTLRVWCYALDTISGSHAPRSWVERAYPNLIHYNKVAKGGHFAAWEQPALFTAELREGFKSLR